MKAPRGPIVRRLPQFAVACLLAVASLQENPAFADGTVVPPRKYAGSLEERAQEAIIIFHGSKKPGQATEDLILKIEVEGNATEFAWIIPFPNEPKIAKEDPKLFRELFDYVEARQRRRSRGEGSAASDSAPKSDAEQAEPVTVLKRKIVGDFDVSIVRENREGGLNPWLDDNGYQPLENAEDVLKFYRDKKYVFACVKVASAALESERSIESHPLRFSFKTGGRDGIYFPMKLTGLQSQPFDVNLYVFYRYWINQKKSQFGYAHRGFRLRYRDWDSSECVPDGGKAYSLPEDDPFLDSMAHRIPTVTKLFQKLHPGAKYYLTNIQAFNLKPEDVREWPDDLWLFPFYRDPDFVPYDVRDGGVASGAYPNVEAKETTLQGTPASPALGVSFASVGLVAFLLIAGVILLRRFRKWNTAKRNWEQYDCGEAKKPGAQSLESD